jgi:2-polyprenyl-3-methyl-5-hydroxy-6-metoxy-1,4-benzoquinol methylase
MDPSSSNVSTNPLENSAPNSQEWWLDFFDGEQSECTLTQETQGAVEFIRTLCRISLSSKNDITLLDQCCGKGYLTHALAEAGFRTIGVDASKSYIEFAHSTFQGSTCQFFQADARGFQPQNLVDIAINWNTSFAYCQEDAENIKMLQALSKALKVGGNFILSTLNPDYILAQFQRFIVRYIPYENSTIIAIRESFLEEEMLSSHWLYIFPDGTRMKRFGQTKLYRLQDFKTMAQQCNLTIEKVYGTLSMEPFHPHSPSIIMVGTKIE